MTQSILFWSAATLQALSTAAFFAGFAFGKPPAERAGSTLLAASLAPLAATLALRWAEVGHGPYQTRYEVIAADAFILVLVWLTASIIACTHFRVLHRWNARRLAYLTFVGLAFAVVTAFVVAMIVPTIHNSYMVGR